MEFLVYLKKQEDEMEGKSDNNDSFQHPAKSTNFSLG